MLVFWNSCHFYHLRSNVICHAPSLNSFLYFGCLGTSTLCSVDMESSRMSSFLLLAEHVPTVVNLSMYRALVGTVWATIRTGASIHHSQVTYSTLSGETKWSFWRNVNNSQWTIRGPTSTHATRELGTERVQSPINIQGPPALVLMFSLMSSSCTDRLITHMRPTSSCSLNALSVLPAVEILLCRLQNKLFCRTLQKWSSLNIIMF